jgi:hypothetical protein
MVASIQEDKSQYSWDLLPALEEKGVRAVPLFSGFETAKHHAV